MWRWRTTINRHITSINHEIRRNLSEKKWRILFFGTDDFSKTSLKELHNELSNGRLIERLEVVTNVTSKPNVIEGFSKKNDLTVHPWKNLSLNKKSFDLGIVVSFGYLIPKAIIEKFPMGMLNVHASLLPRWRGAAPIVHCLLEGDSKTGVSIMRIKPHRFDIGDVIHQERVDIRDDMLQPELYTLLANLGSKSLLNCIRRLPDCLNEATVQSDEEASYAPKIDESLGRIDWENSTAQQIYNLSRALYGIFQLETKFNEFTVKLKLLSVYSELESSDGLNLPPGHFRYCNNKTIRVWCKNNTSVCFSTVKVAGKREMSALDFRNGYMKNVDDELLKFQTIK